MKELKLQFDGWLEGDLGTSDETRTLTRLRLEVGDNILSRNANTRGGGISDAINVPLLPLALAIARNWWPLLYEPFRSGPGDAFKARHRLDLPMHGYIFPRFALCSGGRDTLLSAWAQRSDEHARMEFLAPPSIGPETLPRDQVENTLLDTLEVVISRLDVKGKGYNELSRACDRLRASIGDTDELAYCEIAGKLGLDPYDPEGPDLTVFTSSHSDTVIRDISDAAFVEELLPTTEWLDSAQSILCDAPQIDVGAFGAFPDTDHLSVSAGHFGGEVADIFRQNTNSSYKNPRSHLERIFGDILQKERAAFVRAPATIAALVAREGARARIATVARTAREQRFKVCTAAYIAWAGEPEADHVATAAYTRHQQSSRAFAAEILAPKAYLQERAPKHGFTSTDIEDIAGYLICPYQTVLWQAYRAGVPLRDVETPTPQYPAIA